MLKANTIFYVIFSLKYLEKSKTFKYKCVYTRKKSHLTGNTQEHANIDSAKINLNFNTICCIHRLYSLDTREKPQICMTVAELISSRKNYKNPYFREFSHR